MSEDTGRGTPEWREDDGRMGILAAVGWETTRWLVASLAWIPGALGAAVRTVLLRPLLAGADGPFRMLEHVTLEYPGRLSLGRNVGINLGCWINARGGVGIGEDTILGPYCIVHSANHRSDAAGVPYRTQGYRLERVTIGRNVWLGARVTVLPGVTIGDGAIVGAGAVVNRDIPAGSLAVGVPARVVRSLDPSDDACS